MSTRSKTALLLAVVALLVVPLVGVPAGATPGTVECATVAVVYSQHSGVDTPRPLLSHSDNHWSTQAAVTYACSGAITGFVSTPRTTSTVNPQHCDMATPGGKAPNHGTDAKDDLAFTALCLNPVGGLRPSHVEGSNSVELGAQTCSWTTVGHAQFAGVAVANLDINNFTCGTFGGSDAIGRSHSAAALVFFPGYNVTGECPTIPIPDACWLNAVSVGHFSVVDPS